MIEEDIILFIAQFTSVTTSIIGMIILYYIFMVVKHLNDDSFKNIFSSLAIFFLVTLMGVISMAVYHLVDGKGWDTLESSSEMIWYSFMFLSIAISSYGSHLAIEFGKSFNRVKSMGESKTKRKSSK
ncbi:MAG: hypothetical protein WC471_02215 [Candidatus Woesearchaeota archaeon]|jgi:hypothetical protein